MITFLQWIPGPVRCDPCLLAPSRRGKCSNVVEFIIQQQQQHITGFVVVVVMKMQLHYCSHPVWTMHVVMDILKHESQRTGPGIHCRKVIMSRVGCTSANVCMRRGSIAQPETGTSIVVILHKTLNLTSHNGVAGIFTAYGVSLALGTLHRRSHKNANPEHTI